MFGIDVFISLVISRGPCTPHLMKHRRFRDPQGMSKAPVIILMVMFDAGKGLSSQIKIAEFT